MHIMKENQYIYTNSRSLNVEPTPANVLSTRITITMKGQKKIWALARRFTHLKKRNNDQIGVENSPPEGEAADCGREDEERGHFESAIPPFTEEEDSIENLTGEVGRGGTEQIGVPEIPVLLPSFHLLQVLLRPHRPKPEAPACPRRTRNQEQDE